MKTSRINILIEDNNRYFAFGMAKLLTHYFHSKGKEALFLNSRQVAQAELVIVSSGCCHALPFCQHRDTHFVQRLLIIQDDKLARKTLPTCLRTDGFLRRQDSPDDVLQVIDHILFNLDPAAQSHDGPRCALAFTPREYQVLSALRQGLQPYQAAMLLGLHIKTFSNHKCAAMRKLGFKRNHELYYWLLQGCLEQELMLHSYVSVNVLQKNKNY